MQQIFNKYKFYILGILILAGVGYFALVHKVSQNISQTPNFEATAVSHKSDFPNLAKFQDQLPQFSNYKVSKTISITSALSILDQMGYGWLVNQYKRELKDHNKEIPLLFADHYVVVEYACGFGHCTPPEIIDLDSKTVTNTKLEPLFGISFNPDSRLFIVNPLEMIFDTDFSYEDYNKYADYSIATRYYEFKDGKLHYINSYRIIDDVLKSCLPTSADIMPECKWQ